MIAEQMPTSINCVTLYASPVNNLQNVFTQYLCRNLEEALREPDLYVPDGTGTGANWASTSTRTAK